MGGLAVRQETLRLPQWSGLDLPVLLADDSAFLPIKHLCFVMLGSMDDRSQRAKIKNDAVLSALSRLLPVQTPGGVQNMLCIERIGLGRWINSLSLNAIREKLRPKIAQFQWDIAMAADKILFGEVQGAEVPRFSIASVTKSRPGKGLSDLEVKRALYALAERMGSIEVNQRELQVALLALASGTLDGATKRCPHCGFAFDK